jgi:hypothetical protein
MIKLYDRIKELSYVIGTGNITLSGATRGFSTFSSCYSNGDALFYGITDGTVYELGSGLYVSSSNQIQRFPVKSTNNNSLVNFTEGTKEVYVNYPATNSVFNTSGINPVPKSSGLAFWTSSNSLSYNDNLIFNSGNSRLGLNKSSPSAALDIGGSLAYSQLRVSGISVSESGIYFPSGNNGLSSYSGGRQLVHFQPNQLSSQLSQVLQLSGIVNQNIVLKKQNSNMVFAGPSGYCNPPCGPDYPSFRLLNKYDIPQEIPNLDIGNDNSSVTFLRIFLPGSLPANVYRDINAIEINSNTNVFAVNGLGHIELGTIGYSQVTGLPEEISSVSGFLDTKINNININTASTNHICNGRLSINSGNPIVEGSSDSLFFVPYNGNLISLYNGTAWQTISFDTTLVKTVSTLFPIGVFVDPADKVFDIFAYLNNGSISFESIVWTNTSQRATQLTKKDGIYVKSGDYTRRYIGSVMPISYGGFPPVGGNKFNNTVNHRYIYNYYNRVPVLSKYSLSRTWTCNSSSWRQLLNTYIGFLSSITINILCGVQDDMISPEVSVKCSSQGLSNTNYMLTINSSNFEVLSIGSQLYVPITPSRHLIDILSADSVDYIEKQLHGSMTEVVPVGISTYYVAEKVSSGKNSPNLTFDYNNGIFAEWRC